MSSIYFVMLFTSNLSRDSVLLRGGGGFYTVCKDLKEARIDVEKGGVGIVAGIPQGNKTLFYGVQIFYMQQIRVILDVEFLRKEVRIFSRP